MKQIRIVALILLVGTAALALAQQPPAPAPGQAGARGQRGPQAPPNPKDAGGGSCDRNPMNCIDAVSPVAAVDTVWIEELTWMDVRDAIKKGKDTAIISTGGMEPNGPYLVTGKHNYVLHTNCDAIARKMGTALCAPIIKLVPEGNIDPPTGHMRSPGTISMREETFRMVLEDTARSLKQSGFKNIIFIGDSGGNQAGQQFVAEKLNKEWPGVAVAHIAEYYRYSGAQEFLTSLGVKEGTQENLHDDIAITLNMMIDDPNSVRYDQRVKANKASINGVSIADKKKSLELAKKLVDFRATSTVDAIKKAIAAKPRSSNQ